MPLPDPNRIDIDQLVKTEPKPVLTPEAKVLLSLKNDAQIMEFVKRQGGAVPIDNQGRWLIRCPCLKRNAFCGIRREPDPEGRGMRGICSKPLYTERNFRKMLFGKVGATDRCPYSPDR